MITRIREVRKAKGMTLQDVAAACEPPTTAQTIGRLETGMRTVSVGWLNRIAKAVGVEPTALVTFPDRTDVPVAAILTASGPVAPRRTMTLVPPAPTGTMIGLQIEVAVGDYRTGDALWLERLAPTDFFQALNRDVLIPRPVGRFAFGRLVDTADGRINLLPLNPGARQIVITEVPWIGVVRTLIRML